GATEEPRGRKRMTFFPRFERRPGHRIRARFPVHGARVGNDGKRLRRLRNAGDQSPRAGTFPSRGRHQKKDRPRRQDDGGHDKDEDLAHRCYHPPRMLGSIVRTLSRALAGRVRRSIRRAVRSGVPLSIGVDIRPFYEPLTGIGWYLYHLLHEIAKRDGVELYLFGDARVTDLGPVLHADPPPNAHLCWFDLRGRGRISRPQRALTAAAYVLWMALIDCDVVFGANYFLPRLLGATARRRVITVHDLTWKRFPELLQKETLHNLDVHMAREIAAADAIICVSESTRNDLLAFYQVDPRRVVAIHSGVAPLPALRANLSSLRGTREFAKRRYILFVSTIEPRKNLGVLLEAFERLRARGAYDGDLVVVGRVGWKSETIAGRLRAKGIHHLDYLPPDELAAIYRGADIFVFP